MFVSDNNISMLVLATESTDWVTAGYKGAPMFSCNMYKEKKEKKCSFMWITSLVLLNAEFSGSKHVHSLLLAMLEAMIGTGALWKKILLSTCCMDSSSRRVTMVAE